MKDTIEKMHRHLVRFIDNSPAIGFLRIPNLSDVVASGERCVLVLEEMANPSSPSDLPVTTPGFKQAMFQCAKTAKQKFYRGFLLQNASRPQFAYRDTNDNVVFRSLEIDKDAVVEYYDMMEASVSANVVTIMQNELCIGHRPKRDDLLDLRDEGFTHIVTVLGESEGACDVGREAEKLGFHWLWLPLGSAKVPVQDLNDADNIRDVIRELKSLFLSGDARGTGARVYLHCSAGIHRTGMMTLLLLRKLGYDAEESLHILNQLREESARNIGRQRIQWALEFR